MRGISQRKVFGTGTSFDIEDGGEWRSWDE
jgi:hypothetical protein